MWKDNLLSKAQEENGRLRQDLKSTRRDWWMAMAVAYLTIIVLIVIKQNQRGGLF